MTDLPPKTSATKTPISGSVPRAVSRKIAAIAAAEERSISQIVARALETYAAQYGDDGTKLPVADASNPEQPGFYGIDPMSR